MLSELYRFRQGVFSALIYILAISAGYSLERSNQGQKNTDGISVSVGLEFDRGNYGTADITNNWRIPLSVDYNHGLYFVGIHVPYISAQSTGAVTVSSGSRKRAFTTTSAVISKTSGFGDVNLSAGYNFPAGMNDKMKYYVSAYIKLATADESKGLGTGAVDYAVESGFNRELEQSDFFASIGYQLTGDTAVINYDNSLYANLGFSYGDNNQQQGVMLDYTQSAISTAKDSVEVTGFITQILDKKRSLYFYLLAGLSESSPDYGAGVNYRIDY